MSRTSVIVAREPPDPIIDPRVEEIIIEMNVQVRDGNNQAITYETGEMFNYASDTVHVDEENNGDNDNIGDSGDHDDTDNDNIDDSDDHDDKDNDDMPINVTRKPKMTRKKIREENKWVKETKKDLYKIAMEAMENGEFPSIRACALYYNLEPKTLGLKIRTGEEFVGSGRQSQV